MNLIMLVGIVLIVSALSCKVTDKTGLPILVGFILIGVFIGRWLQFGTLESAERACEFALLVIIFAGGLQTDFAAARPVLPTSVLLSAAGTALTAFAGGAFAYYVMGFEFYEAMLLGAVTSSTDAAAVFSILHSKKLDLIKLP